MIHSVSNSKSDSKKSHGCMGVGLCLFSCIFIALGVGLAIQQAKFWVWKEVPCQLESFEVVDSKNEHEPFEARLTFNYQWEGQNYQSSKFSSNSSDREKKYETLIKIRENCLQRGTCYLNPNNPEEAILQRASSGIWVGLIFALVGSLFFGISLSILRSKKKGDTAISASAKDSTDTGNSPVGFIFFGAFALAGTFALFSLVVPTARKYFAAQAWEPTQATVVWSEVRSHSSDDGTTYSPDIFYRYQFQGEEHRSNSYALFSSSSSGYKRKKEVVQDNPTGHEFTCYVNPKQPWQAVVQRQLGWSALLGLIPLPFLAVGFGGLGWMLVKGRQSEGKHSSASSRSSLTKQEFSPSSSLQKTTSPRGWGKFWGHLFFALFWCGIVSVFVVSAWEKWAEGNPEWFLNIFLIPFVLIGLAALFSLPYSFIAIFSPRFEFALRDEILKPGLATKFRWKKTGGNGELTQLTLILRGQEEATFQQGTDTSTAHSLFYQKELLQTSNLPQILSSECDLVFPSDALPTLNGKTNKIRWFIQIEAQVKRRPNVRHELEVILHPFDENDFS